MMSNKFYAALDVGGTFIKYTLVSPEMEFVLPVRAEPVASLGNADEILGAFRRVAATLTAEAGGRRIAAVCIAICGPMDYENGIFRMTEDKYRAVFGMNLKTELRRGFAIGEGVPVTTTHDVQAFLLGNGVIDPALRQGRVMAITLGTGLGSAFMIDGRIIRPGDGVPDKGLGRLPYGDGKVENYIGAEALRRLYPGGRYTVKELAERAEQGDGDAINVFRRLGTVLGDAALPIVADFKPDVIILGGQIANAEALFLPETRRAIKVPIRRTSDQERAALLGAIVSAR